MSSLKIGLITIHDTLNYGSLLQTYSTYKAIEKLGFNVELIDYKCEKIADRESIKSVSSATSLSEGIKRILWNPSKKRKHKEFWDFINREMRVSEEYNIETIGKSNDMFDAFVVGSDIVWGMSITGHDFTYFLDFVKDNKKKVSFASSVGSMWDKSDERNIQICLNRFDHISVREQLAKEWIQPLVNQDVKVVCDPTMLWTTNDWEKLIKSNSALKCKYILIYLRVDDAKNINDGIEYAKCHGLSVYYINYGKSVAGTKTVRPDSVEEWITLFANAEAVFTASYHGLLFSLYFHRKVFYYNRGNKSRMISLGKELGIEHREGTDENIARDIEINYKSVDEIIDNKRTYSWNILKNSLGD